jgi:hypothetical protein
MIDFFLYVYIYIYILKTMLTSPLLIHFFVFFLNDPTHDITWIKYLVFLKSKINLSYPTPTS